jgi:hypothetical protein
MRIACWIPKSTNKYVIPPLHGVRRKSLNPYVRSFLRRLFSLELYDWDTSEHTTSMVICRRVLPFFHTEGETFLHIYTHR